MQSADPQESVIWGRSRATAWLSTSNRVSHINGSRLVGIKDWELPPYAHLVGISDPAHHFRYACHDCQVYKTSAYRRVVYNNVFVFFWRRLFLTRKHNIAVFMKDRLHRVITKRLWIYKVFFLLNEVVEASKCADLGFHNELWVLVIERKITFGRKTRCSGDSLADSYRGTLSGNKAQRSHVGDREIVVSFSLLFLILSPLFRFHTFLRLFRYRTRCSVSPVHGLHRHKHHISI